MDKLSKIPRKRSAAVLAITTGFIIGALLSNSWMANWGTNIGTANQVDPDVPALTIVAKRLTSAEKDEFARQDHFSDVTADRTGRAPPRVEARIKTPVDSDADVLWKTANVR